MDLLYNSYNILYGDEEPIEVHQYNDFAYNEKYVKTENAQHQSEEGIFFL